VLPLGPNPIAQNGRQFFDIRFANVEVLLQSRTIKTENILCPLSFLADCWEFGIVPYLSFISRKKTKETAEIAKFFIVKKSFTYHGDLCGLGET